MSSGLEIQIKEASLPLEISFIGRIDEDSTFDSVISLNESEVIFNLSEVSFINSCGIREWIEFQKKLGPNLKIIYRECPQVIIEQMNIVKGFIKEGGQIESFYAPYYSNNDDEEFKILISPSEVIDGKAPEKKSESGEVLEFDDIEVQYFGFLGKNG